MSSGLAHAMIKGPRTLTELNPRPVIA
jgi:hypothetical protein